MVSKKIQIGLLFVIFGLGFLVRLYRFDNPIADWHSWRQADTSSVSRNFVKYGFDLLHPRMNNISNVQSGLENPKGYFYAEFPIYNATQAGLYVLFGHLTIEEWGRIITMCMSLVTGLFIFLLIKKRNVLAGWLGLIFFIFLPYDIYYGRVILPDTSMIAMMMGGIYFLDTWLDGLREKTKPHIAFIGLALLFTATSLLLKPHGIFYAITMILLVISVLRWRILIRWELWLLAILSVLPLILWRKYILAYPEGIPVSAWLFNGNGIRFRPSFFRWIFYERIIKLISGYFNALFIPLGVVGRWREKDRWFLFSFAASALVYLFTIATGNVQHDYYQIVIMPAVTIGIGFGAAWAIGFLTKYVRRYGAYSVVGLLMVLGFYISWQQVKDYFNINNRAMVAAGMVVDKMTPKDAEVIAPLDGDSSFLYQTNRQGWASFEHDLPTLIKMGADYLVLANPNPDDYNIGKQYKIIAQSQQYILFDLHKNP